MKGKNSKRKQNQLSRGASIEIEENNNKFVDGNLSFTFDFHSRSSFKVGRLMIRQALRTTL